MNSLTDIAWYIVPDKSIDIQTYGPIKYESYNFYIKFRNIKNAPEYPFGFIITLQNPPKGVVTLDLTICRYRYSDEKKYEKSLRFYDCCNSDTVYMGYSYNKLIEKKEYSEKYLCFHFKFSNIQIIKPSTEEANFKISIEKDWHLPESFIGKEHKKILQSPFQGHSGLINQGETCYMNSALQLLFHLNVFRKLIYSLDGKNDSMIYNLQLLFCKMERKKICKTAKLTKSFGNYNISKQRDVVEFINNFFDSLLRRIGEDDGEKILNIFSGNTLNYIKEEGKENGEENK